MSCMNKCLNYQAIVILLLFLLVCMELLGQCGIISAGSFSKTLPLLAHGRPSLSPASNNSGSNGFNPVRYICFPAQTSNFQPPFIRSCTREKQGTLSLGIWPGHKPHILKALQWRKSYTAITVSTDARSLPNPTDTFHIWLGERIT